LFQSVFSRTNNTAVRHADLLVFCQSSPSYKRRLKNGSQTGNLVVTLTSSYPNTNIFCLNISGFPYVLEIECFILCMVAFELLECEHHFFFSGFCIDYVLLVTQKHE